MPHRGVFLDLNGTLVEPVEVNRPGELLPIPGTAEAVNLLCQSGFVCAVVTVQSRIEKGLYSEAEFLAWFSTFARAMAARGAYIHGPYVCPHRFSTPCPCAKPSTLLYERAAADLSLSLADSVTVGDTLADVQAGLRFGGRGCLVLTGYAARGLPEASDIASFTGHNLREVTNWILRHGAA